MAKHRSTAPGSLTGRRSARRRHGALALLVAATGIGLVSLLLGMLTLTLAPQAVGWRSDVVLSGSMRPALEPGDVVVSAPVQAGDVQVGDIVIVDNPARPGHTLVHRVDSVRADGTLVTRGDANASADSTSVAPAEVLGRGRLRVPGVGMVAVWSQQGRVLPLVAVALAVALATWWAVAGASAAVPRATASGRRRLS
jgi:signal peptidase